MLILQLFLTLLLFILLLFVIAMNVVFIAWTFYRDRYTVPYVPSGNDRIASMLRLAGHGEGKTFIDLGSGDGKIVLAAAQAGFDATGYEVNPLLVYLSRYRIRRAGLAHRARIIRGNFFDLTLPPTDIVYTFFLPRLMGHVARKVQADMPQGTVFLSHTFTVPGHTPHTSDGTVHAYHL